MSTSGDGVGLENHVAITIDDREVSSRLMSIVGMDGIDDASKVKTKVADERGLCTAE